MTEGKRGQNNMPTIGEATRLLGVTPKTFTKWLARVNAMSGPEEQIIPQRNGYDLRFWTITPEEVQRLVDARAQKPETASAASLYPALPAPRSHHAPHAPRQPRLPRPEPVQVIRGEVVEEEEERRFPVPMPETRAHPETRPLPPATRSGGREGRSPDAPVNGYFTSKAHACRWLEWHGVKAFTARSWSEWERMTLTPRAALALALRRSNAADWRTRWRLHRCADAECVCTELLLP